MAEKAKTPSIVVQMRDLEVGFTALNKPYKSKIANDNGEFRESYSISVELDSNNTSPENLKVLQQMMSVLSVQTQPKDIKDPTGLKSTGRFKFGFNDKDPIPVYDGAGKPIPHGSIPMLGKGSVVNIQFRMVQLGRGTYKYIDGIQITKVVEYVPQSPTKTVVFADVGGFSFAEVKAKEEEKSNTVADFSSMF